MSVVCAMSVVVPGLAHREAAIEERVTQSPSKADADTSATKGEGHTRHRPLCTPAIYFFAGSNLTTGFCLFV